MPPKPATSSTHPDHEISALIRVAPEKATQKILAYLREAKMHKGDAAKKIGCAHSTLIAWIAKLDLDPQIEKLDERARKEGWHHGRLGGRPPGSTVAEGAAPRYSKTPRPAPKKAKAKSKGKARAAVH